MSATNFTPREVVSELDRYIVGQDKAKRAVAIALRNRWRRSQTPDDIRDEISPKNIIMIGPTGVGKTEIARRLAKLSKAPFVKVEASKFTEVGYVGRDVDSIVRDLIEVGVQLVREEEKERVQSRAHEHAEAKLVQMLADKLYPPEQTPVSKESGIQLPPNMPQAFGPFVVSGQMPSTGKIEHPVERLDEIRKRLREGEFENEVLELDVTDQGNSFMTVLGGHGMEEMEVNLRDMMSQLPGFKGKTKRRKIKVPDAMKVLEEEEADKLIDEDRVIREAVSRTEESGIVFLDEIDKVAGRQKAGGGGPDVSREGVQRDLLPIIEGSTIHTKYGPVKTDHVLFISAGAFHVSAVSDLIPELQGRFPVRVELESLGEKDFVRILTEPKNALIRQYQALLEAEDLALKFEDAAIASIASFAAEANRNSENIGARRLHTVLEALLEEISFSASEKPEKEFTIDKEYVDNSLSPILKNEDLAKYVL